MAMSDTRPEASRILVRGYAAMTPTERLHRVVELNRSVEALAAARIRREYGPGLSDRELELRLAALRLDRDTMVKVFDWDPEARGL